MALAWHYHRGGFGQPLSEFGALVAVVELTLGQEGACADDFLSIGPWREVAEHRA